MPKALLRDVAMDCISDMAQHLPQSCELFVIACRPGKDDFDLVLPSPEANLNNALDALRRQGLSIDGANIYKEAVCDLVVGALAMGKQNNNPPPAGHWGQQFWDIGRAEGELQEELAAALVKVTADLFYQIEAKHGPKAAAEYPSIVEAKALIAKATA
ncbi:hypothetical protein CMV24_14455 [Pseudomonas plecoglossicida]|uniref:Uncharacterized protein n=1 Tax=Pseudomonas plecoglossicida TaxID=70775 RepID=A0A2A3M3B7_PSEDL|nr:hypothetical protein [Pseudomonas plecoglossicida]PBJ94665.1 hypothetical protein CMV24_14455 [Pseudomonas plecoglossicida]